MLNPQREPDHISTFTTEPGYYIQRGNKTVRKRCIEFIETLRMQKCKEMPLEQAKDNFSLWIDHWDRTTLKAYFGTQEHTVRKEIHKTKEYSGQIYHSQIGLVQEIHNSKGYLEKLGLVHYEKRGKFWFMVLNENGPIIPELMKTFNGIEKSYDNFSLLPNGPSSHNVEDSIAGPLKNLRGPQVARDREEREHIVGERFQLQTKVEPEEYSHGKSLTPEETLILRLKPGLSEPDTSKIQ